MNKQKITFREKIFSGVFWSALGTLGFQGLKLIFGRIIMLYVSPEDFGDLAMVMSIVGFSEVIIDFGFGQALINKKNTDNIDFSSVFWLNVVLGFSLVGLFFFGGILISGFYEKPKLKNIAQVLSLVFFINSLGVVPKAYMLKNLLLKKLAITDLISTISSWGLALFLASKGFGIWSLVCQKIVFSLLILTFLWYFSKWRPQFVFQKERIKDIMNFSLNLLGNKSLNYFTNNIDKILVGKFIGADALGIYSRSYSMVVRPTNSINILLFKVFFPTYSKIQNDSKQIKNIHKSVIEVVFLLLGLFMVTLFFMTEVLIVGVFGDNWLGMIPVMRMMCIAAMVAVIPMSNGSVYLAKGRSDLLFRVNLISRIIAVLGIIVGLQFGIWEVALSLLITNLFRLVISNYYLETLINFTFGDFFKTLIPPILIILPVALVGVVGEYFSLHAIARLLIIIITIILMVYFVKPASYLKIRDTIKNRIK